MLPPLPRCSNWAYSSLVSPSRISLPRKGCRVGLHIDLFEDCSAFTRVAARTLALSPIVTRYTEGFSHFVTSMTAPVASGWSDLAGWDSHPLESAALSRRTPKAVIQIGIAASPVASPTGPRVYACTLSVLSSPHKSCRAPTA